VKFRRNKAEPADPAAEQPAQAPGPEDATAETAEAGPRANGPWDSAEVETGVEEEGDDSSEGAGAAEPARVDLGGLIVTGRPGVELRLQVDEASQQIAAVLMVAQDGALELRPFAAPRNTDIWADIRTRIAAETTRRGGTATEDDGPFGKELRVVMPVTTPDGKPASQPSRVLGISGPRWLLRATYLGKPATQPDPDGVLEAALRDVVVVRGREAMAPGDPLPLVMPANAQPVQPPRQ
jgi:hypothetical protein